MTRKFETKELFFEDKLKLFAIIKTKINEEEGFAETKTYLVNTKAEKVLEIIDFELKTEESCRGSKTSMLKLYEHFFVVETNSKNNEAEKTNFRVYSYHGKLLHIEPRAWIEEVNYPKLESRFVKTFE